MKSITEVVMEQSEIIKGQQAIIDRLFGLLMMSDTDIDEMTLKQMRSLAPEAARVI